VACTIWPKLALGTTRKWPRPKRDRDVGNFSRVETETRRWYVSRSYRDRDVATETTTLPATLSEQSPIDLCEFLEPHTQWRWTIKVVSDHKMTFRHQCSSHLMTVLSLSYSSALLITLKSRWHRKVGPCQRSRREVTPFAGQSLHQILRWFIKAIRGS